eukprot:1756843-Rhodomonas_salina.3
MGIPPLKTRRKITDENADAEALSGAARGRLARTPSLFLRESAVGARARLFVAHRVQAGYRPCRKLRAPLAPPLLLVQNTTCVSTALAPAYPNSVPHWYQNYVSHTTHSKPLVSEPCQPTPDWFSELLSTDTG